jgi:hypothetical protein
MISWANDLRMSLGFDLTLILAAVNLVVFVWFLVYARQEAERPADLIHVTERT